MKKILILFLIIHFKSYSQDLDKVCESYFQAVGGGYEKFGTLKSLIMEQQLTMNNFEMPQKLSILGGKGFRIETKFQGSSSIINMIDNEGWQINPFVTGTNDPKELTENEKYIYKEQMNFQGPLYNYKEKGNKVKLIGKSKVLGEEAFEVEIVNKNNYVLSFFISSKSYYLLKMKDKYRETYFSNFQKINGFVFPFSTQVTSTQGEMLINVFDIKVNPKIELSVFEKK